MQTLSDFRKNWDLSIRQQSTEIASSFEQGQNLIRFLDLEPKLRASVDKVVHEYSLTSIVPGSKISSSDIGYLFHLRLLQALEFAQWLDHSEISDAENTAQDWILFLAIESWHELLVHKWRFEFSKHYGQNPPA